ncbi:hypothetical protein X949_5206 [Burkholderia pseudomallei MSHR5609]|nr:hypothetical protein X949_5206 [Burkholderia pseudomallei MSHR5609]
MLDHFTYPHSMGRLCRDGAERTRGLTPPKRRQIRRLGGSTRIERNRSEGVLAERGSVSIECIGVRRSSQNIAEALV